MQGASREAAGVVRAQLEGTLAELTDPDTRIGLSDALFATADLLDRELRLRRALTDPSAPANAKADLIDRLLGRQLAAPVLDLLRVAVRQRWSRPRDLADVIEEAAASSAFAAAEAAGAIDEVEDELFRFARIVEREPGLHAALTGPYLPAEQKLALVGSLLTGRVHWVTRGVVERLMRAPRGRTIELALADYLRLAARRRERLVADVRVAVPLSAEQADRLARDLGRIYGHQVSLQISIDPDVIGGISVRIGDEVIDATVASRLAEVRRRLTGRSA